MTSDQERQRLTDEVRSTQGDPVAGIWACNNCGRRIQVITDGDKPKLQPFTCVCGAMMEPGGEHANEEADIPRPIVDD